MRGLIPTTPLLLDHGAECAQHPSRGSPSCAASHPSLPGVVDAAGVCRPPPAMRYRQLWVVWPLGFLLLLIFARTREQRVDQEENTVRQRNPWCGGASRENGKGRVRREVRDGVRDLGRGGSRQSCGKGGEEEKSLASRCVCAGVPTPHPDLGPRHGYHHLDRAGRGHSLLLVVSWTRNQLGDTPWH